MSNASQYLNCLPSKYHDIIITLLKGFLVRNTGMDFMSKCMSQYFNSDLSTPMSCYY